MRNPNRNLFLYVQKFLMMLVGKWYVGFNNKTADMIYRLHSLVVELFFLSMTQQILISIIIFRECEERILELICYYAQYTNLNICSFLSKRDKVKVVFDYIIEYEETHLNPSTSHIYLEYAKLNKKIVIFFFSLTASAGIVWYVLAVKSTFHAENIGPCMVKAGLNYQIWYPFDLYNKCYRLIWVVDILLCIVASSFHIYNKVIPVAFMIFILGQIKILQEMIRKLQYTDGNKEILKAVIDCIKTHQEVIRLMSLIDNACKEIVLISFFTNSMELAAFVIKLITEDNIFGALRTIGILFMTITQLFVFFWFASELQVQSTAISDIIYNETNWLNYDTQTRRHLLLMMVRSQKPLTINAVAIGDMSLDVFKRIMKLCYSTATFFETAYL